MKPEMDPVVPWATPVAAAALHSAIARQVRMRTCVISESSRRSDHCSRGAACGPLLEKSSEKHIQINGLTIPLDFREAPRYGGRSRTHSEAGMRSVLLAVAFIFAVSLPGIAQIT